MDRDRCDTTTSPTLRLIPRIVANAHATRVLVVALDDDRESPPVTDVAQENDLRVISLHDADTQLRFDESSVIGCILAPADALPDRRLTDGADRTTSLLRREIDCLPVIALVNPGDVSAAVRAMKNGACDVVERPVQAETLSACVSGALDRSLIRDRTLRAEWSMLQRYYRLTDRERHIADRVRHGLTSKRIAEELDIAPRTVETYRARIKDKLGVRNAADLAVVIERLAEHALCDRRGDDRAADRDAAGQTGPG